MRNPNLITKFERALPVSARHLLDRLLIIAERHALPLFLVGGPLRDLLLDRPSLDLDSAVEGDAMALARELAAATVGRTVTHPTFLTATVRTEGFHLDLITARSETYARPGALPTVKPASIREDLLRRDFTVNALALRLNGPDAGEILDPSGGLADLDARLIRALHERSFQDDATRILRAFRYATRLAFAIEAETLDWLKRDIAYIQTISGARLHHEFSRILAEDTSEEALRSLNDCGALAAIQPTLRFQRTHAAAFARLRELNPTGARAACWPVLAWRLTESEAADLTRRLALTKAQRTALQAMPALRSLESDLHRRHLKRSALVEILSPFALPSLWAAAALVADITVSVRVLDYLTKARHQRPHLTGDDLLALGVPQGPLVGEALARLRAAKLDGEVRSREDEVRLVKQLMADVTPKKTPHPAHPEVSKE